MRNTPLVIPIILGICLLTLGYLIFAAIDAGVDPTIPTVATDEGIVTEEFARQDVRDQPPTPEEAAEAQLDRYFTPPPADEVNVQDSKPLFKEDEDHDNSWENNRVVRELERDLEGGYIVLAGSFRQLLNAQRQVARLKKAGFSESEVSRSNGGAFAIAFVGRRSNEREAEALLSQIERKGFEGRVVAE